LKPGGHLLSFSSARTYHRMVCGIEDAGFEIRDQIAWIFASGFPKSHNLEGEWKGWGTALKPAHEPICVARKPLIGTVAENVLQHGTGAINIDGCRVAVDINADASQLRTMQRGQRTHDMNGQEWGMSKNCGDVPQVVRADGRWPANLIHDGSEEVLACFPDSNGQQGAVTGDEPSSKTNAVYGAFNGRPATMPRNDAGSAARFFYCAKASREDRNEGCDDLPEKTGGMVSNTSGQHITRRDGGAPGPRANHHPTVKPTDLMRYLQRLVTPLGGITLDPFMGSGSSGKAAILESFKFIGIEQDEDEDGNPLGYIDIAVGRIKQAIKARKEQTAQQVMFE
jgi:site-specific DNA-methyltransferase (adenine-specific)